MDVLRPLLCRSVDTELNLEEVSDGPSFKEGEVSEEEQVTEPHSSCLFAPELFQTVFAKVVKMLELQKEQAIKDIASSEKVWGVSSSFPSQQEALKSFLLLETFRAVVLQLWIRTHQDSSCLLLISLPLACWLVSCTFS